MPLTLASLRDEVRLMVGDPVRKDSGGATLVGPQVFTDAQIDAASNFAQVLYCQETWVTMVEGTVSTDANGFGAMPSDAISEAKWASTAGGTLLLTTPAWEDALSDTSRAAGTPKRWHPLGSHAIRVYPSGSISAKVHYLQAPTAMAADGDSPDPRIPTQHQRHLVYAAAGHLLSQASDAQDLAKSKDYFAIFHGILHPPAPSMSGRGEG